MKYFIIKDWFKKAEERTQVPQLFDQYFQISDELFQENPNDLDVVSQPSEMNPEIMIETVILNEAKKAARLQAELEAQDQAKWDVMRAERNKRLTECDWTQLIDSPLSVEQKAVYASYRQTLRDLPENITDINNIQWPVKP